MARVANRRNTLVSLLLFSAVLTAIPASAQGPGVRGGISVNPDQVYLGGHYETTALVERLHFKPNLEIGFGDDVTLVAANFEFVWKFPRPGQWGIYAGGGPAVNFYSFDRFNDTESGFNLLLGAESRRGLAFEIKLGLLDSPDVKFGVGWTFK